ncbi:MAG: glyoxalase [Mycobacterium sp.]|nr:glyoxalase [Mycobacterium sp.]
MPAATVAPFLPCVSAESTIDFLSALGFEVHYLQTEPYLSLAVRLGDIGLQYIHVPEGVAFATEPGGCLVTVDDVADYHAAFTGSLRARYGRVLADARPRISRLRAGQERFQVIDPTGNCLLFVNRDEPLDLDYGGSPSLSGLAKEIDNARILRDFKLDDQMSADALDEALRRFRDTAETRDVARALACRAELAVALGDRVQATRIADEIDRLQLSDDDLIALRSDLESANALLGWLGG